MSKCKYVLISLTVGLASTQLTQAHERNQNRSLSIQGAGAVPTSNTSPVPTVVVLQSTQAVVPTLTLPKPSPTPKPRRTTRVSRGQSTLPRMQWIWAFLTSYCPGSAGWISSSGLPVFYGMLANNFYRFGTRVYMPVLGITGVVEDHLASGTWNHFDVWSPVCYGTPTGWFKVGIVG